MSSLQSQRDKAVELFRQKFGKAATLLVSAPGRVNLIGEHTDYNLLPVLPMPLEQKVRLAIAPNGAQVVRLVNDEECFETAEVDISQPIDTCPGHWSNYCRAALQEVCCRHGYNLAGFDAVVSADLPAAAGLSSSSALVIATCLAFLAVNEIEWTQEELAERMRLAERFVGTAGGGMDQAVIALGRPNAALLIEFDPLQAAEVPVPEGLQVFVINSGQKAEKTGAARFGYNRRALECNLAVELLKRAHGEIAEAGQWQSLRDVYRYCADSGTEWSALLLDTLSPEPQPWREIEKKLGADNFKEICATYKLDTTQITEWLPDGLFEIYARAAHVLGEADRVYRFAEAFRLGNLTAIFENARASHASCRDLYHISTPQIEELVALAETCGAGAARITGAGFGGCIVAFVESAKVAEFQRAILTSGLKPSDILPAHSAGPAGFQKL